ncbi:uncharacterized protein LOC134762280 [Penaeus indicus]|uniref:uncharacterized protein LOC134762280 n=1 Tax=Penaeus indicus TaxID=29960 RepID=UPI00300C2103
MSRKTATCHATPGTCSTRATHPCSTARCCAEWSLRRTWRERRSTLPRAHPTPPGHVSAERESCYKKERKENNKKRASRPQVLHKPLARVRYRVFDTPVLSKQHPGGCSWRPREICSRTSLRVRRVTHLRVIERPPYSPLLVPGRCNAWRGGNTVQHYPPAPAKTNCKRPHLRRPQDGVDEPSPAPRPAFPLGRSRTFIEKGSQRRLSIPGLISPPEGFLRPSPRQRELPIFYPQRKWHFRENSKFS